MRGRDKLSEYKRRLIIVCPCGILDFRYAAPFCRQSASNATTIENRGLMWEFFDPLFIPRRATVPSLMLWTCVGLPIKMLAIRSTWRHQHLSNHHQPPVWSDQWTHSWCGHVASAGRWHSTTPKCTTQRSRSGSVPRGSDFRTLTSCATSTRPSVCAPRTCCSTPTTSIGRVANRSRFRFRFRATGREITRRRCRLRWRVADRRYTPVLRSRLWTQRWRSTTTRREKK